MLSDCGKISIDFTLKLFKSQNLVDLYCHCYPNVTISKLTGKNHIYFQLTSKVTELFFQ